MADQVLAVKTLGLLLSGTPRIGVSDGQHSLLYPASYLATAFDAPGQVPLTSGYAVNPDQRSSQE